MNKEFKILYFGTLVGILAGSMVTSIILNGDSKPIPNKGIEFIWNDDEESIPPDGSAIRLEYTDEDTVYIGPLEDSPEYQFTVTDDSISVKDFDRHVGTVKIEGQLRNLINKDNE
jgi:hypothetical protein